jgi:hypothetical protein
MRAACTAVLALAFLTAARADDLDDFNQSVEAAMSHHRVAAGYLRTGKIDLAVPEIDGLREGWAKVSTLPRPAAFRDQERYTSTSLQLAAQLVGISLVLNLGRADVARWQFWESTSWDPACAILVFERVIKAFFGRGAPDPTEVEKGLQRFQHAAKVLDGHLRGRTYICGNRLTLADFAIGADLTMAEPAQLPLEGYGEIRRWAAILADLPAWQRTRAMQTARR